MRREAKLEKMRNLIQGLKISLMQQDIHDPSEEMIGTFLENVTEAELDENLDNTKYNYHNKRTNNSCGGINQKKIKLRLC